MCARTPIALLLAFTLVGCSKEDPTKPPLIRTVTQYNELAVKAGETSQLPLEKYEAGAELNDDDKKSLKEALRLTKGLAQYDPTAYPNFVAIAKIQRALGDNDAAIDAYEQAVNLEPTVLREVDRTILGEAYADLARISLDIGELKAGVDAAKRAINMQPNNPENYVVMARVQVQLKNHRDADVALKEALKLDPEYEPAVTLWKFIHQSVPGSEKSH